MYGWEEDMAVKIPPIKTIKKYSHLLSDIFMMNKEDSSKKIPR
jgi:hypothetical protein